MSHLRYVVSGAPGPCGTNGHPGPMGGGSGGPGSNGYPGQDSGCINIVLTPNNDTPSGCNVSGTHQGAVTFHRDSTIYLEAAGGSGGHGGQGGSGGMGTTGTPGMNASQGCPGTNGGPGGPGGRGGPGGDGAPGGHGGNCFVRVTQDDMDLLMLNNQCDVRGGRGGNAGAGGQGGAGGMGGPGGAACNWTESEMYTDGNGQMQTRSKSMFSPGGSTGPSGPSGPKGRDGVSAPAGRNATFKEIVDGVGEFSWRYVMKHTHMKLKDVTTDDGIFEPGEACKVWYDLTNTGPMPTPKKQRIMASIYDNQWINAPTTVPAVETFMRPRKTSKLVDSIDYMIADTPEPPPNECFETTTDMIWSVYVERVYKFFTEEETGKRHVLPLKYPVRLSPTHGPAAVARTEECPTAIALHNLCKRTLGYSSGRNLRVHLALVKNATGMKPMTDPNIATLVDETGNPMPNLDLPLEALKSGANFIPSLLVKFGHAAREYSKVTLGVQLYLGNITNFKEDRRIQRMSLDVQLAAYYAAKKNSDVLIVTNHATSLDSFAKWSYASNHLRFVDSNFWNASLHDGFTTTQKVGGSCLKDDYRCATIVVENNNPNFLSELRSDRNTEREHAFDTLLGKELAPMMRDNNVGFCTIGREIDVRRRLLPTDLADVAIPEKYSLFAPPRPADYWLGRLEGCQNPRHGEKYADFEGMHKFYRDQGIADQTAWQLVWGVVTTNTGENTDPIRTKHAPNLHQRICNYFDMYLPFVKPHVINELAAGTNDALLFENLEKIFGPEMVESDHYHHAYKYVLPKQLDAVQAKDDIHGLALKLYSEVSELRPQWKFTVVYQLAPYLTNNKSGEHCIGNIKLEEGPRQELPKRVCIGRMWISRASDRNGAAIMHKTHPPEEPISPHVIVSPEMTYCILKAAPFQKKLWNAVDADFLKIASNYEPLVQSIVSDLVEEQQAMRRFQWSFHVPDWAILEHIPRFCAWIGSCWSVNGNDFGGANKVRLIADVNGMMKNILSRWVKPQDYFMGSRRWRVLSGICNPLINKVMSARHSTGWSEACTRAKQSTRQKKLKELIDFYGNGMADRRCSANQEILTRVISDTMMKGMTMKEHPPHVVEGKWEMHSPRDRQLILHKLRSEFDAFGKVKAKVTRDEQHSRLNFLNCPKDGTDGHYLQAADKGECSICFGRMNGVGPDGKRCGECKWNVCSVCWEAGNAAKWNSVPEKPVEKV